LFVFSKIVGYLLQPFIWVLILLIWAYFTKNARRKKWLTRISILLLVFFSNAWIITNLLLSYQAKPVNLHPGEKFRAGILLGGFMGYDEVTGNAYFNNSSDRFIQTVRLYKLGHIDKIIVSGGNGTLKNNGFREADFIRKNLLEVGIPDSGILIERNSRNTIENGRFVKQLADSIHFNDTSLLITSAFHIPRALKIFRKTGLKVRAYPTSFLVLPSDGLFNAGSLVPSMNAPGLWHIYLRELVGNLKS